MAGSDPDHKDPGTDTGAGEPTPVPAAGDGGAPAPDPGSATVEASTENRETPPGEAAEGNDVEESPGEAHAVEQDLDELVVKARERDEYLSLAQRTQADFENFRKRAARDISAAEARGIGRLAKELLPALDSLERALAAVRGGSPEAQHLAEGVRLVAADMTSALARVGIEAFSPEGERFDPNQHEAMAQQPVEGAESGTVVEVYQQGYRANGAVLRPARVVVAQ